MSRARILILTAAHLCRNPRVLKEAGTLGSAGYDVTVLTTSTHLSFEQLDLALMRGQPFRREIIDLTPRNVRTRTRSFLQRSVMWAARRLLRHAGIALPQALGPARALLRGARKHSADLIIAHTEIPLWAAVRLRREGSRVAVDMEDWYSEDLLPADRAGRPVRLLRAAESFALYHAAYVSVTSQSMADALHNAYGGQRSLVVRNTFPLQANPRSARPAGAGSPRLVWFSQTVGPGRGLESFLASWTRTARPSSLTLLGDVRPGYREQLLALVTPDRRSNLQFLPPVAPDELPAKLAEFDVGLALEATVPRSRDVTITNKILQYLNAGLAVLATRTAGQREVMRAAPDCGLEIDLADAEKTRSQLDDLLVNPAHLAQMQAEARRAAEREFCWKMDAPRLLGAVAHALEQPVRATQ
jgi:glycosyltransferase involved in cell wall biosynthesis